MKLDVTVRIPPNVLTALEARAHLEHIPLTTWLIRTGLRQAWRVVHHVERDLTGQSSPDAASDTAIELGLTREEFNAFQEAVAATYRWRGNELAQLSIGAFIEGAVRRELRRNAEAAGGDR